MVDIPITDHTKENSYPVVVPQADNININNNHRGLATSMVTPAKRIAASRTRSMEDKAFLIIKLKFLMNKNRFNFLLRKARNLFVIGIVPLFLDLMSLLLY